MRRISTAMGTTKIPPRTRTTRNKPSRLHHRIFVGDIDQPHRGLQETEVADGRRAHPGPREQTQRLAVKRIGARIDRAHLSQAFDQFVALLFDFGAPHGSASDTSLTRELSLLDEVRRCFPMRLSAVPAKRPFYHGLGFRA